MSVGTREKLDARENGNRGDDHPSAFQPLGDRDERGVRLLRPQWVAADGVLVEHSANDLRLDGGRALLQDDDEPLPCRSLWEVVERVEVEVAVLGVEVGVRAVSEVAEVAAGNADVAVDDAEDLAVSQTRCCLNCR